MTDIELCSPTNVETIIIYGKDTEHSEVNLVGNIMHNRSTNEMDILADSNDSFTTNVIVKSADAFQPDRTMNGRYLEP